MQSISAADPPPLPNCCNPIPTHFHLTKKSPLTIPQSFPKRSRHCSHSTRPSSITLAQTHSYIKQQQHKTTTESDPYHNHPLVLQFFSSTGNNPSNNQNPESQFGQKQEQKQDDDGETKTPKGLFTNMWWADMKAALGQSLNAGAIVCSVRVVVKDRHLALPHVAVPDITYIDWDELQRRGFKGVVFDKDNTLTSPYSLRLWGPLALSLEQCKSVFGPNIAVFSNSAGKF